MDGEVKTAVGTCREVVQKPGSDWVEFHIDVGSRYPVRLATKLDALIQEARAVGQEVATWTYKESDGNPNPNKPGEFYKNRYLSKVEAGATLLEDQPHASASPSSGTDGMSKEEWARKDSAIHKMACIKTAADALKHTIPSEPTTEALNKFNERVIHLALAWHRSVLAERDDPTGDDIPFD